MLERPHKGVFWLIDGKIWQFHLMSKNMNMGFQSREILMCIEKSGSQ